MKAKEAKQEAEWKAINFTLQDLYQYWNHDQVDHALGWAIEKTRELKEKWQLCMMVNNDKLEGLVLYTWSVNHEDGMVHKTMFNAFSFGRR
jgi:hypothetical protein